MRAIVQRVSSAWVEVGERRLGQISTGFLLLVGVHRDDDELDAHKLADRIQGLRIFNDDEGKINLNLASVKGEVLAVSNFTVYGDASQRRPSFGISAGYERGRELFELFVEKLRGMDVKVHTGEFGAEMHVTLVNDGPVTLVVDTR